MIDRLLRGAIIPSLDTSWSHGPSGDSWERRRPGGSSCRLPVFRPWCGRLARTVTRGQLLARHPNDPIQVFLGLTLAASREAQDGARSYPLPSRQAARPRTVRDHTRYPRGKPRGTGRPAIIPATLAASREAQDIFRYRRACVSRPGLPVARLGPPVAGTASSNDSYETRCRKGRRKSVSD